MSGDYSRDGFDALRDYAGLFLQQGRAVLDSDWNELVRIFERRIRTGTVDTIGRAVVPRETPRGFEIRPAGDGLEIGEGHFYLDGVLYQNHGRADFGGDRPERPAPVFDRARIGATGAEGVLDEMIAPEAGDYLPYDEQPWWPTPDPLPGPGRHLVYLVGWQREVTPTEAPELLEPALGGLDTTTRWQSVWQVRLLADIGADITCATPDGDLPGWQAVSAPSTARLSTATVAVEEPENPCLVPPTDGYTGIENQFYRIEIHALRNPEGAGDPPGQGDWGFKFSRENASVRSTVTAIAADGESLTVGRIGRDEVLRFAPGDWVEITDDIREFNHRSGQMLRIADVDPETRQIEFETAIPAELIPSGAAGDTLAARHTRLIRWDQRGLVRLADAAGSEWVDLDADGADGLIPVPPGGTPVLLENGITVAFSTADGPGTFREMDHWRFAARTAGTQIEILRDAPPDGVQRHYARLAILTGAGPNAGASVSDCRIFWPPEFGEGGGDCCACTLCVSPESHASGALTIQEAIDRIGPEGGTVCLEGGLYPLREPVRIAGRSAIRLTGQGLGTVLVWQGAGGAIQVSGANDIRLDGFGILAAPGDPNPAGGAALPVHGVTAENCALLALRRLAVLVAAPNPEDRFDFAIALDGMQLGAKIEECLAIGPHAVGSRSTYGLDQDGDPQFVAFAELRLLDCILFGGRVGVLFDRVVLNLAAAILSRNVVLSMAGGIRMALAEFDAASLAVESSTVMAGGSALVLSAGTLRVQDCEISGGDQAGDGLVLAPPLVQGMAGDAQVIGNTIHDTAAAGIRIIGAHDTIFIKRNIIRDTGQAGIVTDPSAQIRHIAVDNNNIERIGMVADAGFAIGIALTMAETGQIVGNAIRDIGETGFSGQLYAGIGVQGVGSVDISSNVISGVGGRQPESSGIGILARAPYLGLTIGANRIFGTMEPGEDFIDWRAIQIGDTLVPRGDLDEGPGLAAAGYLAALPAHQPTSMAYLNANGRTWRATADAFVAALPAAPSQLTLTGNQARAGLRPTGAIIHVLDPFARGTAFAHNHCDLPSEGVRLDQVVFLAATRITVTANTVTHAGGELSMLIVTGRGGAATPVGNITSGRILVSPGGMAPAFAGLNLNA